eukprot:4546960-Prymnesium_polylepis.1
MPCPEHSPWAIDAAASALVRATHDSLMIIGLQAISALAARSAAAALCPGCGATTHSCRASRLSPWHSCTQAHVVGKAGCVWMPHGATSGLRPHWSTHAGNRGSEQSSPLRNGGQSHRPSARLHVPRSVHLGWQSRRSSGCATA